MTLEPLGIYIYILIHFLLTQEARDLHQNTNLHLSFDLLIHLPKQNFAHFA